jgi:hypothetical protein
MFTGNDRHLAECNAHPRDSNITFDEGPHIYYLNGVKVDISVTTWIGKLFSHFDPEETWRKIASKTNEPGNKYYGMTKQQVLAQWKLAGEEASKMGTAMHRDIELYWNGCEVTNESIEYTFFKQFVVDYPMLVPYRTEWVIYSVPLKMSGSVDGVFRAPLLASFGGVGGEHGGSGEMGYEIYDWKRTKEFSLSNYGKFAIPELTRYPDTSYWHYVCQLNLYRYILETEYGLKIQRLVLVRLHPDSDKYDRVEVPFLYDELVQMVQYRRKQVGLPEDPTLVKTGKTIYTTGAINWIGCGPGGSSANIGGNGNGCGSEGSSVNEGGSGNGEREDYRSMPCMIKIPPRVKK